jgi:ribonucleoside-triphosphate reductase
MDFNAYFDSLMNARGVMADMSVDPNANVAGRSMASVMQEASKPFMKEYCLSKLFEHVDIENKVREGELYVSDSHMLYAPYCWNFSVSHLMAFGLPFIPGVPSKPAMHASSFVQHAIQLIMYASNHQSGAAALTSFFVGLDWYVRKDSLDEREIRQLFQIFTYSVNQPVRFSAQSPYVNLSVFDRFYLKGLYGDFRYPDGSGLDEASVMKLQRMYVEWFVEEIEKTGFIFTFPVLTACLLLDEKGRIKDEAFLHWLSGVNSKYGMINIYLSKSADSLSSCCRLRNDLGYVNSFGSGGDGVGSVGVCAINLPHVALISKDEDEFFKRLEEDVSDAQACVEFRRAWVEKNISRGLLPLYDHGFMDLERQYCTVGIVGAWEAREILGVKDYISFSKKILGTINRLNEARRKRTGFPYNVEQVPAENMAVYMAQKDRESGLQYKYDIYSNQWIPLSCGASVIERIHTAGQLDRLATGGAILHVNTQGHVSPETHKEIVKLCGSMGVVYFALNYVLSRCTKCDEIHVGEPVLCTCGCSVFDKFTRVVGFVTPVKNWKKERREEFGKRIKYDLEREHEKSIAC